MVQCLGYMKWTKILGAGSLTTNGANHVRGIHLWGEVGNSKPILRIRGSLFGNNLIGPVPPEVGNIATLLELDLSYNEFTSPSQPRCQLQDV
ncbi:hypothetical protein PIB30_061557 [Stylosanthes scabra]|uniref:Uncharacterized protein n=1 Tax=Stylosanthes scabra TaxID=79078 RepID=A0ABU6UJY1_9FABA|nr:hypothetical protein [Stylosanthes scabra]